MTLEQLQIFVEVARRGHVTAAAQALHKTQSAVSAAIQALEARHGVVLFDRIGRNIQLNQAGQIFLTEAEAVLARSKAAICALDDLSTMQRGHLVLMASQTAGSYWLPEKLALYHKRWPHITLHISLGNSQDVAEAVSSALVEIGLVEAEIRGPDLIHQLAATDDMILVVGTKHPWSYAMHDMNVAAPALSAPVNWPSKRQQGADAGFLHDVFASTPWIMREEGSGTRVAAEQILQENGLTLAAMPKVIVLPSNEAVLGAVEANMGATFVSRRAAKARLMSNLLVEIPFCTSTRSFYLLRHRERHQSRASQAFYDICLNAPMEHSDKS